MKILHINNFKQCDYLNDMMFHGGRSLFGDDYEESNDCPHMYKDFPNKHTLYGRGFTIYGKLPKKTKSDTKTLYERLLDRDFDFIAYGSVFRDISLFDTVKKVYPKNRIICFDGEDHTGIRWDLVGKCVYFKRELTVQTADVYPIQFSIPKDIITIATEKNKLLAQIDPRNLSTYVYSDEMAYYKDYQESYFGYTKKKAGWDCLRHLEILANNCFPAFEDINGCPPLTLNKFPKFIISDYYKEHQWNFSSDYWPAMDQMRQVLNNELTTEAMWRYVLGIL